MIEILNDFPDDVVAVVCHGHVTRDDYLKVLVPAVEDALDRHEKLRLYYEIGPDLSGIDPGAMWEDTKVGIGHLRRWERMAVVTDIEWIRHTVNVFGFLLPGELKVFPSEEADQARRWILAG